MSFREYLDNLDEAKNVTIKVDDFSYYKDFRQGEEVFSDLIAAMKKAKVTMKLKKAGTGPTSGDTVLLTGPEEAVNSIVRDHLSEL